MHLGERSCARRPGGEGAGTKLLDLTHRPGPVVDGRDPRNALPNSQTMKRAQFNHDSERCACAEQLWFGVPAVRFEGNGG